MNVISKATSGAMLATLGLVEGLLFMRGFDGIHCYDLRKKE